MEDLVGHDSAQDGGRLFTSFRLLIGRVLAIYKLAIVLHYTGFKSQTFVISACAFGAGGDKEEFHDSRFLDSYCSYRQHKTFENVM